MSENETRAQITELINTKIAAGDADGATYVALVVLTEVLPVLERIAKGLEKIDTALAPDLAGYSVGEGLSSIKAFLSTWAQPVLRKLNDQLGEG